MSTYERMPSVKDLSALSGIGEEDLTQLLRLFHEEGIGKPENRRRGGALPRAISSMWDTKKGREILEKVRSNDTVLGGILKFAQHHHDGTQIKRLQAVMALSIEEQISIARTNVQEVINNLE